MMNEDNAKTMVRTRRMPFRPAPNSDPDQSVNVLPVGTHLGEFEILDLIGEGGFGIVYLAYDHSLERHVALKEYMPSGLAIRTTSMAVTVRSQHNAATFTAGLKSFINEARMLAQFDSPSLVKVHRFWEGNGTAYMVMPFYEGITLKQALKERRITPTESWIRLLLADLFDAIETIHNAHCLHRDIAPDNILLLKDGRPLLLDFGAARRVIGDLTQCLTVILKPGFAPIEQYADIAGLRQGEWTDIYALAAVVYYLITGKAPPPAVARMVNDELVPARKAGKGRYSDAFLGVLDKALSVKPEQRYRSIAELRHALDIMGTVPRTLPGESSHWATTVARTAIKEEEPEPMPSAPAKEAIRPQPQMQHRTQPQPSGRPHIRTEPKFHTKPPVPEADNPPVHPETTQYLHAAAPFDQSWMKPNQDESTTGIRSRRDRKEWLVLGLLLSAGIASGVYVGMNRSWQKSDGAAILASPGSTTMQSSGASDTAEQESDTQPPAAAAPSPAPASSAPASSPRTTATPAPALASAAPKATESSGPAQQPSPTPAPLTPSMQSEIDLWRAASESDKASAYENYLREYPRGRYAALAKIRLERKQPKTAMLTPSEIEAPTKALEKKAKAAPTEPAPASSTKEAAPALQPSHEPAAARDTSRNSAKDASKDAPPAKAASGRNAEEELWNTVTTINDGPAYEAYLYQYPKGRYAALARDKLGKSASSALAPAFTSESAQKTAKAAEKPPAAEASPVVPERSLPETLPKQASIKPAEPASAAPVRKTPAEPAQPAQPAAPAADQAAPSPSSPPTGGGKKTIRTAGQTMIGDFTADPKTGIVSGTGRIVWSNGDQFDGTLVNGKKEGKGKFSWSNGQRYSGDWEHDIPNGKGVIIFTDGSRYEGDVKDGVPHGQGTTRFKHGDVYRGDWVRGRSHGHGRYTWANGSYWEGEFRDDKRTENGKMVFADQATGNTSGSSASAPPKTSGEMQQAERRATSE